MTKLALCLIVKGSDSEAEILHRCLSYTSPYVDRMFITLTQPNELVRKVVGGFKNAELSEFKWVNDFSKARNFNFSQVPKEYDYILWLDADDVPRGLENLKDTMEKNPADAYSMNYLYAFDEQKNPTVVHMKTRVVKNDGCVEWAGALHEDFKENREIKVFFIKDIDILHLSNEQRFNQAKERNLEVAQGQLRENPNDPRSFWNVGNSLKALGRDEEAIKIFDTFLETSRSDDEKYIVRLRRAESYWALDQKDKAIDECRYAIGTKPQFPDAYHLLGSLYYEKKMYAEAAAMYLTGMKKKPPYYSIIVYNPREYDWQPLMNLAKAYFQLNLPSLALVCLEGCLKIYPNDEKTKQLVDLMKVETEKFDKVGMMIKKIKRLKKKESIKKALDEIPDEFKSHPGVCAIRNEHFKKETSSGKDLVYFCGLTREEWTPETAKTKGIGGSEEAVIHLSELFAKKGWNVTVYNNCGFKEQKFGNVIYKPFWEWNPSDKQDVTILWRAPRFLDYEINSGKVYLDLHDVIQAGELTEERVGKVNRIFVKSNFHRSFYPKVNDSKFVIIPNGIDSEVFEKNSIRDPYLIINTSSPDRGVNVLLDLFKEVKKQVPQAKMKWAYGWNVWDTVYAGNSEMMSWKEKVEKKFGDGAENLGRLGHGEIAKLYMQAGVFAYPSEFAEIDCISLSKAMAGGALPICTNFSSVGEKGKFGYYIKSDKTIDTWSPPGKFDYSITDEKQKKEWVEKCVMTLQNPPSDEQIENMRNYARVTYDWKNIVNRWDKEFNSKV